jgi:hypothetical protein
MAVDNIEDIYPLSPMQAGILFESLYATDGAVYLDQQSYEVDGEIEPCILESALEYLVRRHAALRMEVRTHQC